MTDTIIRYNTVARALHWIIGGLIIANVALGILHEPLEDIVKLMPLHQSIGLTVLVLSILRLFWRLTHKVPPLPAGLPGWQVGAAHLVHWGFYAMMILVPLTGWIMSSAGKWPISYFSLVEVPKFAVTKGDLVVGLSHEGHEVLGILFIPLIVIHVAAALHHHVVLKNNVLLRMTGKPLRD